GRARSQVPPDRQRSADERSGAPGLRPTAGPLRYGVVLCDARSPAAVRGQQPSEPRRLAAVPRSFRLLIGAVRQARGATASASGGPHVPGAYWWTGVALPSTGSTIVHAVSTSSSRTNSIGSPRSASPIRRS